MQAKTSGAEYALHAPFEVTGGAKDYRSYRTLQRFCPRCNGPLQRVPRRKLDRLISWVMPVQRYRCCAMNCCWTGNVRVKRSTLSIRGRR